MAKKNDVQMSIKMEPALRDQFMAVAEERDRPAAQIIRELMRFYISNHEATKALTSEDRKKIQAAITLDMFKNLGM